MNNKHISLLKVMTAQNGWATASFLASRLNVSERSIKNYISEINTFHKGAIESSRKGYLVNKELAYALLENGKVDLPSTSEERVNYIMKALLMNNDAENKAIDLYQMSEDIFVSYETIKKDLVKVKARALDYDLYLNSSSSSVSLEGREKNKRKLLANIIYEEFKKNVLCVSVIQDVFHHIDVSLLQSIILEECEKFHFYINGYALLSLVLDIIIGMERIRNHYTFDLSDNERLAFGIREQELSSNIAKKIEGNFNVRYSEAELEELTIILLSHLMKFDYNKIDRSNIVEVVGESCLALSLDLLSDIRNKGYFIDYDNNEFVVKFTLHVKNLLPRLEQGQEIKNPLTNHIKVSCPLIFECAVNIADHLKELTGYEINEDEIAYIALHIGGYLGKDETLSKKITCVIVFPQYYNMVNRVIERMTQEFGDTILIRGVLDSVNKLNGMDPVDLIITTLALPKKIQAEEVLVTPFCSEKDIITIKDRIKTIKRNKNKKRLYDHMHQISNPKFFYKNKAFSNEKEAIEFMVDIMHKENYVDEHYLEEVFVRERQSSTAFGNIAVPHSLKMCAKKTGLFVLLNEKPFPWGEHLVNIVLLFTINKEDRALFYDIFDNLVVLLLESPYASKVTQCKTYEEFIDVILSCYE